MKKIALAVLASAMIMLASCTTIRPAAVTSNPIGNKVGEATGTYLFGALPLGKCDSSLQTAAKNGGITKIATVDQKFYMGFFVNKITTIVTGE